MTIDLWGTGHIDVMDIYLAGGTFKAYPSVQPKVTIGSGWVCPKCGSVYAPWVPACDKCNKEPKGVEDQQAMYCFGGGYDKK